MNIMCFLCRGYACGSSCNTSMQSLAPGIRQRCISIAFCKDSNSFTLEPYWVQTYEVFTPNIHEVGQVYPYPLTNPKINRESKFYEGWSSHPEGIPYWDGIYILEKFSPMKPDSQAAPATRAAEPRNGTAKYWS